MADDAPETARTILYGSSGRTLFSEDAPLLVHHRVLTVRMFQAGEGDSAATVSARAVSGRRGGRQSWRGARRPSASVRAADRWRRIRPPLTPAPARPPNRVRSGLRVSRRRGDPAPGGALRSPASSTSSALRSGSRRVKLLEDAGCAVDVPAAQTCCGQPAYNSGDSSDTRAIAKRTIEAFESFDYVVAPSGSCAGMLREHYPRLFPTGDDWHARARSLADRTQRACELPHRRARGTRRRSPARGPRDVPRLVLGPSRDGGPRSAAHAARICRRAEALRDARRGHLLRLRRDLLRQVPGDLHPSRRREVRECARDRRRGAARGRSRVAC